MAYGRKGRRHGKFRGKRYHAKGRHKTRVSRFYTVPRGGIRL